MCLSTVMASIYDDDVYLVQYFTPVYSVLIIGASLVYIMRMLGKEGIGSDQDPPTPVLRHDFPMKTGR